MSSKRAGILLVGLLAVAGCGRSESYKQGQLMADRTYGSMAPEQMMAQMSVVGQQIEAELEKAPNKRDWFNGLCDRGEEIWLERIDAMNEAMGQQVLNPAQIKQMFGQMRAGFRE